MHIKSKDLINIADEKIFPIDIKSVTLESDPYLKRLEDVKGDITFYYDVTDKLVIDYNLKGKMVCPDPYTLEDVYLDFDLSDVEEVVFSDMEDGFYIPKDTSDNELILNIVLPEVPIKVEKTNKMSYYVGDDWRVMSEEEYDSSQKNKIDPRLAKLLDYKEED